MREKLNKNLLIIALLTTSYMVAEFIGAYFANSLTLLADATHMLSDSFALMFALVAAWIATRPPDSKKTYGYYRTEIISALINGLLLIVLACSIIYKAYLRIFVQHEVEAVLMLIVATGGLFVNIVGILILKNDAQSNLNVKGAYLNLIGDSLGSIGAIISGLLILKWQLFISDTIASFIIAILILYNAVNLVSESINILLEASPPNVDVKKIRKTIQDLPCVKSIHELHVWSISSAETALSVHIVAEKNSQNPLDLVIETIKNEYKIDKITVQLEPQNFDKDNK